MVKVSVFQKDGGMQVPICYCFNWTRARIVGEIQKTGKSDAETAILTQVKAGRCSCDVNNPQGRCCLANVRSFVKDRAILN